MLLFCVHHVPEYFGCLPYLVHIQRFFYGMHIPHAKAQNNASITVARQNIGITAAANNIAIFFIVLISFFYQMI